MLDLILKKDLSIEDCEPLAEAAGVYSSVYPRPPAHPVGLVYKAVRGLVLCVTSMVFLVCFVHNGIVDITRD